MRLIGTSPSLGCEQGPTEIDGDRFSTWSRGDRRGAAFVALYLAAAATFFAPTLMLSLDPNGTNTVDEAFADFARGLSTVGDAFVLVCSTFAAAGALGATLAWRAGETESAP
jgi:hypothetical protein